MVKSKKQTCLEGEMGTSLTSETVLITPTSRGDLPVY